MIRLTTGVLRVVEIMQEENIQNLFMGIKERDFYVLVDQDFFPAAHNMKIGSFTSVHPQPGSDNLMFIMNPKCNSFVSPFQSNLTRKYLAEYNFEIGRRQYFPDYPSRLEAVFLFETEREAHKYISRYEKQVSGRTLKKVRTNGQYCYSLHDSSWVDFSRLTGWKDDDTIDTVCKAYWSGQKVEGQRLKSIEKVWSEEAIIEVLYNGRVDFYE